MVRRRNEAKLAGLGEGEYDSEMKTYLVMLTRRCQLLDCAASSCF